MVNVRFSSDSDDRIDLFSCGENPQKLTAEVALAGDDSWHQALRVSVINAAGECVGDVYVGLSDQGELRVLLTADGKGDDAHSIAVYPQRPAASAVEIDHEDGVGMRPQNGLLTQGPRS